MAKQWNVGDVVVLKSGGPRMTVSSDDGDGYVTCDWFDGKGDPQAKTFPSDILKTPDA